MESSGSGKGTPFSHETFFNVFVYVGSLDPQAARRRMEEKFRENASRPLTSGVMVSTFSLTDILVLSKHFQQNVPEVLPHVYTSSSAVQGNVLSHLGTGYELPIGHTREDHDVSSSESQTHSEVAFY